MYALPRIRLCAAQQPIATSALFVYLGAVVSTVVYLAIPGDGSTTVRTAHAAAVDATAAVDSGIGDGDAPPGPDTSLHGLRRYALNAFLVPLLDDASPSRWRDPAWTMNCAGASAVFIDGRPLVPGERIPPRSFSLRWHMIDCRPLSDTEAFDGEVQLDVFHEEDGYSAVVHPHLVVRTLRTTERWSQAFAATTP
jgi:hypothetical protein